MNGYNIDMSVYRILICHWFNFHFRFFLVMVIYDNEFETKENI